MTPNKRGGDEMDSFSLTFDINVELPFEVACCPEKFDWWVKKLAEIQKEYSCNCTLSIKAN
ncbi:hypothetical protein [uncultured Veillonella sp.]|uniref:hypothetical protein n=1 Tax=uncultured Veillonella sp. TaxID=159268 RepID=UPI00262064F7|nr:hypothetical protein [uncultured Veillonella sp.]